MEATNTTHLNILVIGAGPVGLVTATALAKAGHTVKVLERHADLQTTGGLILINPNGVKAFRQIGIEAEMAEMGFPIDKSTYASYKAPNDWATIPISVLEPCYSIMRTDIQRAAYQTALAAGATVVFDQKVVRWDGGAAAAGPTVWTADGSRYSADVVVAADGIKSKIRKSIYPKEPVDAVVTSEVVYISWIPIEPLGQDERFAAYLKPAQFNMIMGPGSYMMTGITPKGLWMGLFTVGSLGSKSGSEVVDPDSVNGSWNISADPSHVQQLVEHFPEAPRELFSRVTTWEKWHVGAAPDIKSWSDENKKTVLIGDAAHAFPPHSAQGFTMGAEDACCLAQLLAASRGEDDDVTAALEAFETLRRPRVSKISQMAWAMGARQTLPDGPEQKARDAGFKQLSKASLATLAIDWSTIQMDADAPFMTPQFQRWRREYDVGQATADYLAAQRT